MRFILLVFAFLGFVGALRLAGRALLRLLARGVEAFIASEASRTHARRGDITALQAADEMRAATRRNRVQALAIFAGSVALLAVPPFTPWTAVLYACYLPLWLVQRSPVRG